MLFIRYTFFAVLATIVNLLVQRFVLSSTYGELQLILAIALGTVAGLVVKYVLDKYWIFADVTSSLSQTGKQFLLYGSTGLFTTAVFWGSEYVSWLIWGNDFARECGAVVGLAIGYVCKYKLDRKYVFNHI